MADDLGALSLLGESADWLKDAEGMSIRDHRVAAREAYRAAWLHPKDDAADAEFRSAAGKLIEALRHNHLYPEGMVLGEDPEGANRYLARLETVRKDFEQLRDFCVVNRFGIGEIHMLYFVLLLCRILFESTERPYDEMLQEAIGDVTYLRVPIYRADNLAPFSSELQARLHSVRLMRAMQKLGMFDDSPRVKLTTNDQSEIASLLADRLRAEAAEYIQRRHKIAYSTLDTASALEAYARAHAANRAPLDERSPEEIFAQLRHAIRRLGRRTSISDARRERMQSLAVAAIVRSIAHVDTMLAKKLYSFLRSGRNMPTVRHGRMFRLLPNSAERLGFVNFLYTNGSQNPVYYIDRFEKYFDDDKLRFVRKEIGFHLDRAAGE